MPRYRSRQIETESVNPRLLRRGAVKRQHITRWAVGFDEIAPGVVGEIHLHPTTIEVIREAAAGVGVGQLLVRSATGQSFADGGDYVMPDVTIYQHGFADVVSAADPVVWPVDAVGEIQIEFEWDTYEGGGTIEIEVDGAVPAWGLVASGTSGKRGCKHRSVHISEGSTVRVKVTQDSGDPQTGSAHVEYAIQDPSLDVSLPPPPPGPTELGPRIWYRAESLSLGDGAPVPVWQDISGNDFHLQQVNATKQPILRTGVIAGKAAVEFDGTDDAMSVTAALVTSLEWTVFAVFLTNDSAAYQMIVNGDDQTSDPGFARGPVFLQIASGVLSMVNEGSSTLESSGQAVTEDVWHLAEGRRSTTEMEALLDGVGNGPTASAAVAPKAGIFIGYHPASSTAYMDGQIAEVIGWDRLLTSGERTIVLDYFNDEYGL